MFYLYASYILRGRNLPKKLNHFNSFYVLYFSGNLHSEYKCTVVRDWDLSTQSEWRKAKKKRALIKFDQVC